MKDIVFEAVKRLTENQKVKHKGPEHVQYLDLKKDLGGQIGQAITELLEEGKIMVGHTINDKYIELKETTRDGI